MEVRAGIYARVSTRHSNNKDLTIENQILIARGYIKDNGMTCTKIYIEI